MKVLVRIELGAPNLRLTKDVFLAAAPRVGDAICFDNDSVIYAEHVIICPEFVLVRNPKPIDEEDAKWYRKKGFK